MLELLWNYGGFYLAYVALVSVVSFVAYGIDKRRASSSDSSQRISERTLHTIDLLGGWPGGYWGRRVFRHKTLKRSFVIAFWVTVVLHLAMVMAVCWLIHMMFFQQT